MSLTGSDGPPIVLIAVVVLGIVAVGVAGASEPDSNFNVTIQAANTDVSAGALIEVTATVKNTGSEQDSQQIHLKDFETDIVDSRARPSSTPVSLAPGEQTTVTLQWWTDEGDVGNGTLSVQSDDHTDRLSASIQEAPTLDVESESVASSVEVGDRLEVPMQVTNLGNESVETTAWLRYNESTIDHSQLEIPANGSVEVTLSWSPSANEVGAVDLSAGVGLDNVLEHTVTVESVSQSQSGGGTVWVSSSDDDDDDDEEDDEAEENTTTSLYPDLLQNKSTARIDNDTANLTNSSVVQVTFEEPVSGNVSVEELRGLPNATDPINDSVVIASITVPEAANETNATIEFRLEDRNNSTDERYVLHRWNGSAWNGLETETVRENESIVATARTPGFSIFALTNESRVSETSMNETTTNSTTTEPTLTTTTVPTTTTTEPEPSTVTETPVPTTASETTVVTTTDEPTTSSPLDSGLMGMIGPGLAIVGIALVVGYFARKP